MPKRIVTPFLRAALAAAALALAGRPCRAADEPGQEAGVETGQIQGARFAIAVPPGSWNHRLLLLVHGYRPESAPLIPDLHPERESNKVLLGEGWIVATTSFRRNGLVVADAIADVDALRAYVASAYGEPNRVILEGESLGGLIVTIMAERDKGPYDGAIAYDPTLSAKESNSTVGLSLLPRIPLLFVATRQDAAGPTSYMTTLSARPDPAVQPALFLIARDGHTNINQAEHLEAIRAMNDWIDGGADALPQPQPPSRYFDATLKPLPGPSTSQMHLDGMGFESRVSDVDRVYGNMLIEAQAPDFAAAGITPMTYFQLVAGGKVYRTLYGRTYSDVKIGEWVAFPDAEGHTVLSRYLADGAAAAGLKPGDAVSLVRYPAGAAAP